MVSYPTSTSATFGSSSLSDIHNSTVVSAAPHPHIHRSVPSAEAIVDLLVLDEPAVTVTAEARNYSYLPEPESK